jgi:hypothetical protein
VDDDSPVALGEAVDTARLLRWMLILAGLLIDGTYLPLFYHGVFHLDGPKLNTAQTKIFVMVERVEIRSSSLPLFSTEQYFRVVTDCKKILRGANFETDCRM